MKWIGDYSLVVSGHTSLTPPAMLAPQGCPDHALNTKVRLIVLPKTDEFIDNGFLLRNAVHLRHKAWVEGHTAVVKPSAQADEDSKTEIREQVAISGFWEMSAIHFQEVDCSLN